MLEVEKNNGYVLDRLHTAIGSPLTVSLTAVLCWADDLTLYECYVCYHICLLMDGLHDGIVRI